MNKLCSSILVVERNYWTFGVMFLSNFSKLQPTVAAEPFEDFFGEKSNCLIVFGHWAKETVLWQKTYSRFAKSAFHVSSAKLWEKMIKVIYTIIIFFRTLSEFFLILAKKSQVCRNSNLSVQRKNFKKKYSWTIGFSSFLEFYKKKLHFYRKVFGRIVKTTFYVSRVTLTAQHFRKEVLKT